MKTNLENVAVKKKSVKMKWKFLFRDKKIFAIYLVTFILFYNEVLTYWLVTLSWSSIDCDGKIKCTKILLVADPQLAGVHHEIPYVTPFAIWDSDRYLSTTFSYSFKFTRPDLIIFLGDLFHEGSTSTDDEFENYVYRLRRIFEPIWTAGVEHIYVPGNNDVGGEDGITQSNVERFERFFKQSAIFWTKKLKVHNTNRLLRTNAHRIEGETGPVVGISHLSLITTNDNYTDQVFEQLEPHVLFTAHNYDAVIYKENYDDRPHEDDIPMVTEVKNNEIYVRRIETGQVHEFRVPTCSYRMGTQKIGYGVAVIDEEEVRYTVLWTPSRFPQLMVYGILVLICLHWFLFTLFKKFIQPRYKILQQDETR